MKPTLFGLIFGAALGLPACGSSGLGTVPSGDSGPRVSGADGGLTGETGVADASEAGPPVPNLKDNVWTWVDVPEAHCRDGSSTGFAINANSASNKLMIFLEGGGACFNVLTCTANPSSFAGSDFAGSTASSSPGIFSRSDTANPVNDWNYVFIPYCTGDVHAGDNPNGSITGLPGTQQFVGYSNIAKDLGRLVPTFPNVTEVLLTGVSAGGFGAAANYVQVAQAFGSVPVYLLNDSGPPMRDPYAATCLQDEWVKTWGFDRTFLKECGSDCPDLANFAIDAIKHAVRHYPKVPFGLIESTDDNTITMFYGFGQSNCTGYAQLTKQQFTDGLTDTRAQLASDTNFGGFVFDGTRHTTLVDPAFDTQMAGGDAGAVLLTDWIKELVNQGKVSNVGPP